jgi:hypothetical protein
MENKEDLSYLSAFFYIGAVLLGLCAIFSWLNHNYFLAGVWLVLTIGVIVSLRLASRHDES